MTDAFLELIFGSFPEFLKALWVATGRDTKAPLGPTELDIADWIANGDQQRGVLAFRSIGKALALDTPIPTPSGWTTMGDIREGDVLFDENGAQCRVIGVSPIATGRTCYQVRFADGTSIVSDEQHEWPVYDRYSSQRKTLRVRTTGHIKDRVHYPSKARQFKQHRFASKINGPLQCEHAELPIDPYLFGLWIGNGSHECGALHWHDDDGDHLRSEVQKTGTSLTTFASSLKDGGKGRSGTVRGLGATIQASAFYKNKHLPLAYLRASVSQRMSLLQGIVDSDGHITDQSGTCEISTVNPVLRDGYLELVRSLGIRVSCCTGRATIYGRDCGPKYRINFKTYADNPISRNPRKIARLRPRGKIQPNNTNKAIVAVTPIDSVPVRCIAVDSKSRLYLAGLGMIPTHNTHIAMAYAGWRLFRDPTIKILVVSKSTGHAKAAVGLLREWIRNVSFLKHLDPDLDPLCSDTTYQFDVAGVPSDSLNPSVLAKGIEGQITGTHCHLIIADDIETPENSKTVDARVALRGKVHEFAAIASFGKKEVCYLGTYHHPDSLYFEEAKSGYIFRTWPFTYPAPGKKHLNLAPIITEHLASGFKKPGDLTCPLWWGPDDIIRQKAHGDIHWRMQMQLESDLRTGTVYPLRLSDLIVFPVHRDKAPVSIAWGMTDARGGTVSTGIQIPLIVSGEDRLHAPIMVDPVWSPYISTKGYIDPSGRGRDLTGFSAVGQLGSYLWVKACYGLPGGGSTERMDHLAKLARQHGVRDLYYEDNADTLGTYGPLLEAALMRHFLEPHSEAAMEAGFPEGWKCSLTRDHATGQKELRIIAALEPVISSHRLVVHPDAVTPDPALIKEHELQWQLAMLTPERGCFVEDGRIDSLAGCVRMFSETLRNDPRKAGNAAKRREIEREIDEHNALTRGKSDKPKPRWMTV